MRTVIWNRAKAIFAMILVLAVACSLVYIPGFGSARLAHAEDASSAPSIYVSGVDFLQTEAEGWDMLRVENLGDNTLYITIKKDGKPLSAPVKFTAEDSNVSGDYTGDGGKIAQIVAMQVMDGGSAATVQSIFGNQDNHSRYTITVSSALMQGKTYFEGTIYPIYGQIINLDGSSNPPVLLGVRTVANGDTSAARNIGVGETYYKQNTTEAAYPTSYSLQRQNGVDNYFNGNAYIVTYRENDKATTIEGTINYVDVTTGQTIETETIGGIGSEPKTVSIKKSLAVVVKSDDGQETVKYYRAVSQMAGKQVQLGWDEAKGVFNASYTVNVIEVMGMDETAYTVTINYVDEQDRLLFSDEVEVKGYGYRYTLPNTFSMNKKLNSSNEASTLSSEDDANVSDGVNFYRLARIAGGEVVDGTALDDEILDSIASDKEKALSVGASGGNGTAVNLTKGLSLDQFMLDENGNRVVKVVYDSQNVTKEVEFTLIEIDGETGDEIGRITQKVTPDPETSFSYTLENKTINGKKYVPWSGNPESIEYSWEALGQSVDLMQYVYYVPEGYVPGDAYDITIQYVNIANGAVLDKVELSVDPEMTNYVEFVGPERFTQGSNEYVRVAGQESGIRHAFFSPNRTYTVYYRDVNDNITPNIVITNTQIIQTPLPGTGGGLTAATTPIEGADGDGPFAEAGIAPGDGTVIINDDDNPLANLDGQDTATERAIAENENPLAFGPGGLSPLAIAGIAVGVLAIIGVIAFLLVRRRRQSQENNSI